MNSIILATSHSFLPSLEFKVFMTTKLSQLINAYCLRSNRKPEELAFAFNDIIIKGDDTPESLGMKDGNNIKILLR